jgi:hypothetical protein
VLLLTNFEIEFKEESYTRQALPFAGVERIDMKLFLLCMVLIFFPFSVQAVRVVQKYVPTHKNWQGTESEPSTMKVLSIDFPQIASIRWSFKGQVRYQDVIPQGYLEMWSYFPDGTRFFSKTLGPAPMQAIRGSSGWRPFEVVFTSQAKMSAPNKLELNLVLPGAGQVEFGSISLLQYEAEEYPMLVGQWWTDQSAGLMGTLGGLLLGCLGGGLGWLAARGQSRHLVLRSLFALVVTGVILLSLAIYSIAVGQPYSVYYPLILLGGVCLFVMGWIFIQARKRFIGLGL